MCFRDLSSLRAMPLFQTDPEPGLRVAAPHLGLEKRYIVTSDADAFLRATRYYLSKGYPVRVAVNVLRILGEEGFSPHSELLVGYDQSGGEDRFIEGSEGLWLTDQALLDAVRDLSERFNLPWTFSLTIFEEREREEDLTDVWSRNGALLIGTRWGPAQGSVGIREFAVRHRRDRAGDGLAAHRPRVGGWITAQIGECRIPNPAEPEPKRHVVATAEKIQYRNRTPTMGNICRVSATYCLYTDGAGRYLLPTQLGGPSHWLPGGP